MLTWMLWGMGLFQAAWAAHAGAPHRHMLPFGVPHWGKELPLAALAGADAAPGRHARGAWLQLPGVALLALASLVILGLSFATVRGLRAGTLLAPAARRSFPSSRNPALREPRRIAQWPPIARLPPAPAEPCNMAVLQDEKSRTDLLHRLKRAEGQLRGIQRMIEEGEECLAIAGQMSAVRKALDSAYVRMTVCFMEQELSAKLGDKPSSKAELGHMLDNASRRCWARSADARPAARRVTSGWTECAGGPSWPRREQESPMKHALLACALALAAGTAFAHNCPNEMKAIDACSPPIPSSATPTPPGQAAARRRRGRPRPASDDSMKSLGEAKKILGI